MAKKKNNVGTPKGSVRPKIDMYWSQDDIADYFKWLKKAYKKDVRLGIFVGEHLMGKAVQPIANDDDKPFKIEGIEISIRK